MVWPWLVTIGLTASVVLLVVLALALRRGEAWLDAIFAWAIVAGIGIFIFGIMGLNISVSRHYDRVGCRTFQRTTNRPTRFVIYTTFSWDCLTPTAGGKWIPTKNLREFGDNR